MGRTGRGFTPKMPQAASPHLGCLCRRTAAPTAAHAWWTCSGCSSWLPASPGAGGWWPNTRSQIRGSVEQDTKRLPLYRFPLSSKNAMVSTPAKARSQSASSTASSANRAVAPWLSLISKMEWQFWISWLNLYFYRGIHANWRSNVGNCFVSLLCSWWFQLPFSVCQWLQTWGQNMPKHSCPKKFESWLPVRWVYGNPYLIYPIVKVYIHHLPHQTHLTLHESLVQGLPHQSMGTSTGNHG